MNLGPYDVPGSYTGDCRDLMRELPAECVQCVVTSPPYWGLRDYGVDGQLGLEKTPQEYVAAMVDVFREVRRVLRADGTLWLNLGDSYASRGGDTQTGFNARYFGTDMANGKQGDPRKFATQEIDTGLAPKNLVGIPWRVAFALQADGWILRSDIIWAKPNPMPESVTDRPTKAHEYMFMFAKQPRYYYDADAIREQWADERCGAPGGRKPAERNVGGRTDGFTRPRQDWTAPDGRKGRNRRSVWTVASAPYSGAHFACFPPNLIEPCILAGSRPGDVVFDPFFGSGTTGRVAEEHNRLWLGFDLNPEYGKLQDERTRNVQKRLPGVQG